MTPVLLPNQFQLDSYDLSTHILQRCLALVVPLPLCGRSNELYAYDVISGYFIANANVATFKITLVKEIHFFELRQILPPANTFLSKAIMIP